MTSAFTMPTMLQRTPKIEERSGRSFFNMVGPYLPTLFVLSVAISILVYIAVMQTLGWRTPVFSANGVISFMAPSSQKVMLYASANTKRYLAGIGGNYETLLVPWRGYFADRKLGFNEIADVADLRQQKEGVLILPSALSLSTEERAEILSFRDRGGAILSTWATGSRSENGDWQGWTFLNTLGVQMLGEIAPEVEVNNLILNGESPVSHTHPAGMRLGLSKTTERLLRFKGEMVAARFMNWTRITDDERRTEGAVVFNETRPEVGRVVAFAFAETVWESHPLLAYGLIDDTLAWLRREPAVVLASWPQGKLAAQTIEMDTEQGFPNALPFLSMMQAVDYPTSFYVLTSVGKTFPDILTRLNLESEVGYHGDIHTSFKDQTAAEQTRRVQNMRSEMASVLGGTQAITGFRAPTEGYDSTTEMVLQQAGIRHHTADPNRSESRLPLIAKQEGLANKDALVVLPRTQRDDINLFWEKLSPEQTTQALIDDANQVRDSGALGVLSIHSQNFGADSILVKAMPGLLVHLKQQNATVWLASTGQVAKWWRQRDRIKLSSSYSGKRLLINITVTGNEPVAGASFTLLLPQRGILPKVESAKIGFDKPIVKKIDNYRVSVIFESLKPGNYEYQATFSP
ncbi:MAG: polysaccharide deacetylase family protein [Rhodoferax sp.]|nr:polysaccharide deacetylase family protein [Rhodoferax sp.]NCS60915.1 polysaccharide deacetylase family protein [Rhodoferax sp.]OIP13265.1 MAG: hypothetical protein AUK50_13760 [Comamonadaceae bacterium CG2_30_57_122]